MVAYWRWQPQWANHYMIARWDVVVPSLETNGNVASFARTHANRTYRPRGVAESHCGGRIVNTRQFESLVTFHLSL
jgi:hypothetical protein